MYEFIRRTLRLRGRLTAVLRTATPAPPSAGTDRPRGGRRPRAGREQRQALAKKNIFGNKTALAAPAPRETFLGDCHHPTTPCYPPVWHMQKQGGSDGVVVVW